MCSSPVRSGVERIKNLVLDYGLSSTAQLPPLHAALIRHSLEHEPLILGHILRFTSDHGRGRGRYPLLLFHQIKRPRAEIFLWNTVIRGLVSNDHFSEALEIYDSMRCRGLLPNNFTLPFILKAAARSSYPALGMKLQALVAKLGFCGDVFVQTGLVNLYMKCGRLKDACKVFDEIPRKNTVSWTAIISGFIDSGRFPLIDMYAKCGAVARAWEVFRAMRNTDRVVWNAAISGLAMNGHVRTVFGLFGEMEKIRIEPDGNTFMGLLCACTHAGLLSDGRQYFYSMERVYSLTPTIEHYGCLVDLLGRAGQLEEAHGLIMSSIAFGMVHAPVRITGEMAIESEKA
ncbi:hypothetical protein SAY86_007374 [Trapa natans]|uniref:Pentatricopeptide repeat-containing protein n=1 Tax=Trapa natans TaxID=22666 RepID=A0AAN7LDC4_TRANT|nr:hypothetical protein SAY86_007374 [Trapa natans]